ncbi:MAG: oligosaccharide flippase family protein [Parcubacteria group bacterium]|nr:oligosaccharide flippase family protein [Parcubacteria group bacterium]
MIFRQNIIRFLRWTEKFTRTDMVYIAKGGGWTTVWRVANFSISFAIMTAFANLVSLEIYGRYQYVLSLVGLVAVFSLPGMETALIRSVAKGFESTFPKAFLTRIKWGFLGSLVIVGVAFWTHLQGGDDALVSILLLAAVFLPFRSTAGFTTAFWRGRKNFFAEALFQVTLTGGVATIVITTLFFTDSLFYIVLSFFAAQSVLGIFLYRIAYLHIRPTSEDESLIPYGKSLTLMGTVGIISDHLDKIILFAFLSPIQLATYAFAIDPARKVRGLIPISDLLLPKLSENGVVGDKRKQRVFMKMLSMFIVTIPLAIMLALVTPYIYGFVFPQYIESVPYFQVLTILLALVPFTVLGVSLEAEMQIQSQYITKISIPVLKIGLFIILIPIYGIWGLIATLLVTEVVKDILTTYLFWKMK